MKKKFFRIISIFLIVFFITSFSLCYKNKANANPFALPFTIGSLLSPAGVVCLALLVGSGAVFVNSGEASYCANYLKEKIKKDLKLTEAEISYGIKVTDNLLSLVKETITELSATPQNISYFSDGVEMSFFPADYTTRTKFPISLPSFPANDYRVCVQAVNSSGNVIHETRTRFDFKAMPNNYYLVKDGNSIGIANSVYSGFCSVVRLANKELIDYITLKVTFTNVSTGAIYIPESVGHSICVDFKKDFENANVLNIPDVIPDNGYISAKDVDIPINLSKDFSVDTVGDLVNIGDGTVIGEGEGEGTDTGEGEGTDTGEDTGNPSIPDMSLPGEVKLDFSPLTINLKDKFPFCIPFDLISTIRNFKAAAVAPKFTVTFPKLYGMQGGSFVIDFGNFKKIVLILRYFILLVFVANLIKITRNIIKG